jgi:hypothetical protein
LRNNLAQDGVGALEVNNGFLHGETTDRGGTSTVF